MAVREPLYDGLTVKERQMLLSAIGEMKSRGLNISTILPKREDCNWTTDSNGYFLTQSGRRYNPCQKAADFINDDSRFLLLCGGRGSGKTTTSAQKALKKIMQGESGAVMNPDFENFKLSTWTEFREWIPWDMVVENQKYRRNAEWIPHQPFTMVFKNGAVVYCKGLKSPDSARGPNINWLWYDEAGRDETGMGWKIANASVRVGNQPQSWASATPRGTSHWMYKFFVQKELTTEVSDLLSKTLGERKPISLYFISIEDNKDNLSPDFYAAMLANYPAGWLREQELAGKFVDEGKSMGDRTWFEGKILPRLPDNEVITGRVRYWDMAATQKKLIGKHKSDDPDYTTGTLLSQARLGAFYIEHQVASQISWLNIKRLIVETAIRDGKEVPIYIEQEPGSGGINQVAEIAVIPELAGYTVRAHNPSRLGDKVMRAQPWFAKAQLNLIYIIEGDWVENFLQQLSSFPTAAHDDLVDSVSGAFHCLAPIKRWAKPDFIAI